MSARIGNIYLLRWKEPVAADVARVLEEVAEAKQAHGDMLTYLAIAGTDSTPPDDSTRSAITKAMDDLRHNCSAVHLVIEGRGFRQIMLRSIATGVFLVSGNRTTHMHQTIEDAVSSIGMQGAEAEAFYREAARHGLLGPDYEGSSPAS